MEDKEQVTEYITRVAKAVNQLGKNGESMSVSRVTEKILRSLIVDFESIEFTIEELKDLSALSLEELLGHFRNKGERKRRSPLT